MKKPLAYAVVLGALVFGLFVGVAVGRRSTMLPGGSAKKNEKGNAISDSGDPSTGSRGSASDHKREDKVSPTAGTTSSKGYGLYPPELDLGEMKEGQARDVKVELRRPAETKIRIASVKTSCPCLQFVPRPLIVPADDEAVLNFQLHTLTMHGEETKTIYVKLMEPEEVTLTATIAAAVERVPAKIMLEPDVLHFGVVQDSKMLPVRIHNLTKQDIRLNKITATHDGLFGTAVEQKTVIPGGGSVVIEVLAEAKELAAGPLSEHLRIETDLPEQTVIAVPADGTVRK